MLSTALAAQTVFAVVLLVFALRAWSRVRDTRMSFLATAFLLLLAQTSILLVSAATTLLTLQEGLTGGTFVGLAAFVALYLAILRP